MKQSLKKCIAAILSSAMLLGTVPAGAVFAETPQSSVFAAIADNGAYVYDFMELVENGADTSYGEAEDVVVIDENLTAALTYEGTYVSADGKVYIKSDTVCNGNGKYKNGSYISFTAPADGTLVVEGKDIGWFSGDTYEGYGSTITIDDAKAGATYNFGYRKGSTYVDTITFTPSAPATEAPTKDPSVTPAPFELPYTWDFSADQTSSEGVNVPVVSGSASWDSGNQNIKFDANTTESGGLSVDFDKPLKGNVDLSFNLNVGNLGQQYFTYTMTDSEGIELIYCQFEKYNGIAQLRIGGETVAVDGEITAAINAVTDDGMKAETTLFKNSVDFWSKTAEVTIGDTVFTGSIQPEAVGDVARFAAESTRSKTAGRSIYLDDLSLSYFDSDKEQAIPEIAQGYSEGSYTDGENTIGYRYRLPEGYDASQKYPVVVYLHSESRSGSDNVSQLYNAQYIFNAAAAAAPCILIAPQCPEDGEWVEGYEDASYTMAPDPSVYLSMVSGLIDDFAEQNPGVDTGRIILAGQSAGAAAVWELALREPYKFEAIVPIGGAGSVSDTQMIQALADSGTAVWAFHGYMDEQVPVTEARRIVSALQSEGAANVRYTEYPYDGHAVAEKAASEAGLFDFLFGEKDNDKTVDLAIFMGQSNMCGRGDYEEAVSCAPGHGYEFHGVTEPSVLTTVSEPFGKYENNSTINDAGSNGVDRRSGDMVSALMESYYQQTGVPIVGVQCSRGGTNLNWWNGSGVRAEAVSRFKEAEDFLTASGYTIRRKMIVWCQGEADADRAASEDSYKNGTLSFFDYMEENTGVTDKFIVQTGHYNINYGLEEGQTPSQDAIDKDTNYANVNRYQQRLDAEHDDITSVASFYSDEYLAGMRDQYHYYQPVYNAVGTTAGHNIAAFYDSSIEPIPVTGAEDDPISPTAEPTMAPPATLEPTDDEVVEVSFDYNDEAAASPVFAKTGSADMSQTYKAKADASDKYLSLASSGSVGTSKAFGATMDLGSYTDGAKTVELSFDMHIGAGKRTYVNFGDSQLRGDNFGGSSGSSPSSTGSALTMSVFKEDFAINGADLTDKLKINGDASDESKITDFQWAHYDLVFNCSDAVMSYRVTSLDGSTEYLAAENVPFGDTSVSVIDTIDVYSWLAGDQVDIDNLHIKATIPAISLSVEGEGAIAKVKGSTVTQQYTLEKSYEDASETVTWSVSGVDGVSIDPATGILSVADTAAEGTATVTATVNGGSTVPAGTIASKSVQIGGWAEVASYELSGALTLGVGMSTDIKPVTVVDTNGHDITKYVKISQVVSSDPSVIAVDGTTLTAKAAGNAVVSLVIDTGSDAAANKVTLDVRSGVFEITSSETAIDVSPLVTYGTNSFRIYSDGGYTSQEAVGGKVTNTTGGTVTVVPEYKFEFTDLSSSDNPYINGYTKVGVNSYSRDTGYGLLNVGSITENGYNAVDGRPIKADLPDGAYDISIYRKATGRADVYLNGRQFMQNLGGSGGSTFNRNASEAYLTAEQIKVEGGTADITVGNTGGGSNAGCITSIEFVKVPEQYRRPVVWVAGDSTAADYFPQDLDGDDLASDKIMITGFGTQLEKVLSDKYAVNNLGQAGRYAKDWYDESFNDMLWYMSEGDVLIIDFGINDGNKNRGIEEAKQYISDMAAAAKAKGATPILVSPIYNGKYQHKTYFTYDPETGTNVMSELASELGVAFIDLNKWTQQYVNEAREQTGDANWMANNYHVGDNLHLTQHSALLAASIIAAGMSELGYETSDFAYAYKDIAGIDEGSMRGEETGVTRVYSVEEAKKLMGIAPDSDYPVTVSYDEDAEALTLTAADGTQSALAMILSYNGDGTMKNVKMDPVVFEGQKAVIDGIQLSEGDRVLVWDSINTMKPLADVFVYTPVQEPEITPAPTPTDAPAVTEEPIEIIYEQDFESFDEVSKGDASVADGWFSPAGTASVKTDSTSGINRYMAITGGNASRSGYFNLSSAVSEDFVFEADIKTSRNGRVSELQLVESQSSVYQNHGVENTKRYVFTMDRPRNEDLYVINNGKSDSGLSLEDYNQPALTTAAIENDPWIHVKVVGSFENGTVIVYVTSRDGSVEYYRGVSDMSEGIESFKCIHLLGPTANVDTCIDNIKLYKARGSDLAVTYHKVTMTCKSYTFDQYVIDGKSVINIPDTSAYGEHFEGWEVNGALYTTEQLATLPITSDCTITGRISEDYIEAMESVEFNSFPAGGELVMGADENTFGSNPVSLTITGEQGTSLVSSPDSRVTDYNVEWTLDGFRILDGRPTGESGSSYCEGYGELSPTAAHNTAVDFKLKRTSANYYGRITAKVTYNGKTIEISRPLVLLGDKSSRDILPKPGYTADYNKYEDSLIGYSLSQNDLLFGGWQTYGSDSAYMKFAGDNSGKYLSFSRAASGNSMVAYNEIGQISTQTVFEQDVRFGIDGGVSYVGGGTMTAPDSTAFSFNKSGSELRFNGKTIYNEADSDTWYHIVIHADPTSQKCFARVYELADDYSGKEMLAESGVMDFDEYTSASAYRVSLTKDNKNSIDVNNIRVYEAEVDEATISVTAPATAQIPESGSNEVELSVTAVMADGSEYIGKPEWAVGDEFAEGVSITSAGSTATLSIESAASSGELPIRVTVGGKTKTLTIKLTGTRDSLSFTEAPAGIRLDAAGTYKFTAVVRNGQAEEIAGRQVTYALTDENGSAVSPAGVSIAADGTLSVSADAKPQTIYITASAQGSDGETITRRVRTTLYGFDFVFGTGAAEDGCTSVSATASYSDSIGFGVDGGSENDDGLTGGTFRLKLEKGKVYEVTAVYNGSLTCERINSKLTGFVRESDGAKADVFNTAIFGDDIMDIEIDGTLESVSVRPVERTAAAEPDWWTIGDSTIQQNGSWAYTITSSQTDNLTKYPELDAVIDTFHNSGRAGRQHKSFYSEGLLNNILANIRPGDVVSISGMGTNDSSSTFEEFKEYDEIYMNAIIDMGAYVILGSYTPSGNYGETEGKVYDADNMAFKGMRTNSYDRAIRELYEENKDNPKVLGFLDIGQMSDDKMTADVQKVYADTQGTEDEKRAAANARAEEMMGWWRDYNHYNSNFSNYILPEITAAAAELIAAIS